MFGISVLFAINKAWINLSNGGDTSFNVLFIVEYHFSVGTSFSLDTGEFCLKMNMSSIMFSITCQPLCNIWETSNHDNRTAGLISFPLQSIS